LRIVAEVVSRPGAGFQAEHEPRGPTKAWS